MKCELGKILMDFSLSEEILNKRHRKNSNSAHRENPQIKHINMLTLLPDKH